MPRPWFAPSPPAVAVEITSRRVTVVELGRSGGAPVVSAHASESLPAGAVTPAATGVNVVDAAAVTAALRRALERAGLSSRSRAALILPDTIARVSLLSLEHVPAKPSDLDQVIRWQLRKATPYPIDEAQLSYFVASSDGPGTLMAAVVARRDVVEQYEAVMAAAGIHAGIVDLSSFNVINAVIAAGAAPVADWLLVCLAPEGTTLAIMRGQNLMSYRHRVAVDQESLGSLVHQMAMYHEDRLGGSTFARVWLCGGAGNTTGSDAARRELEAQLGTAVETVDVRPAAELRDRVSASVDVLDTLAAPVGVLLRERKAA